jgi:fatty-acyl-CoA synthase
MGSVDTWVGFWGRRGHVRPVIAVGAEILTWGSLADRSSRLAAGLARAGASPGSRVGVVSRDPVRVIEVITACAWLGAVAAPLDPAAGPERLRSIAAGAGLSALVTDSGLAPVLAPVLAPDRTFTSGPAAEGQRRYEELLGQGHLSRAAEPGMDDPLLLLHTRGTTGAPKGAVLSHGNVEAVAAAVIAADGLVPRDCVGIALPSIATPTGVAATLGALHAGALIRFGHDGPAALLDDGNLARLTVLVTTCEQLGSAGLTGRLAAHGPAGPRLVKVAGPVPTELRRRCQSLGIPLVEMYGLAEGGGLNLQQPAGNASPDPPRPLLVPLLGQQARVVDATGATTPPGQPGELVLAGSAVMDRYPAARAERLLRDGWLHTGDLAVADSGGNLTILGRCPPHAPQNRNEGQLT